MKTFEEKWTAWLDGGLTGRELADFEASLPDKAVAEEEKRDAKRLGVFLKEQLQPRAMGNEEFFHHQLRERMTTDARAANVPERAGAARPAFWPIGRLVWVGATSLAIFSLCTFFVLREKAPTDQSQYLTQILNWRVDPTMGPNATISMFEAKDGKVTVLWVDGLQSLPSEYANTR